MKLLSELQDLSEGESKSFLHSVLEAIMNLEYEFIGRQMKVDANAINLSISEGPIIDMLLCI